MVEVGQEVIVGQTFMTRLFPGRRRSNCVVTDTYEERSKLLLRDPGFGFCQIGTRRGKIVGKGFFGGTNLEFLTQGNGQFGRILTEEEFRQFCESMGSQGQAIMRNYGRSRIVPYPQGR